MLHHVEQSFAIYSLESKIRGAATQCSYQTALGVYCSSMDNGLSFDAIFCIVNRIMINVFGRPFLVLM